jgi:hypothetical protein
MSKRRPRCPQCLSNEILRVMYGMPTEKAWEESQQGKFMIGGCCVSDESPKWHCPACKHEFGKYMMSIEDLENPEPDGIKPLKLEFFIGGYSGPNHSVRLENGVLKYKLFKEHPDSPDKELEIVPTGRKWLSFRKKLDAINAWKWERRYVDPSVCDGTQWELEIDYGLKKIESSGSNSYPGCEGILIVDESQTNQASDFDALLHALKLLLGGVNIV